MATYTYTQLQKKYQDFALPQAHIYMGGRLLTNADDTMVIDELTIELTSGFEASIARFRLYNVYSFDTGQFLFDQIKDKLAMGTTMSIKLGYTSEVTACFLGFVSGISFGYESGSLPYIEVTGMDVKGIMMAGTYVNQLKADNYADAVSEIFQRTGYERLKSSGAILKFTVTATPDLDPSLLSALESQEAAAEAAAQAQEAAAAAEAAAKVSNSAEDAAAAAALVEQANAAISAVTAAMEAFNTAKDTLTATKAAVSTATAQAAAAGPTPTPATIPSGPVSAYTMEFNAESDYEFVVKAAKKFNYEFFTQAGEVLFRKAKPSTTSLMELGSNSGMLSFHVEYSMTGLVGSIETRTMNPGDGSIISSTLTLDNTISTGTAASAIVKQGKKVYIDPTLDSQTQADCRTASLMEKMSYRLGTLEAECIGIPELQPGHFITISGLGSPVDNNFYLASVIHDFKADRGYRTKIVGQVNKIQTSTT